MKKKDAEETATTLEALIELAHARGLRINSLFQFQDTLRANVNDRPQFYKFGDRK